MRWLSPPALLAVCWGLTGAVAALALLLPGVFDLLPVFLHREGLDIGAFSWLGGVWILTALAAFLVGDLAGQVQRPARPGLAPAAAPRERTGAINAPSMFPEIDPLRDSHRRVVTPSAPPPAVRKHACNLPRAARITARVNALFLGVTLLWVLITAVQNGGIASLVAQATEDALGTRDLLLENKLFTGMRLFYAALPATGCLAAAILAAGGRALPRRARRRCRGVLILNTIALFLLPIVMSQRLLLLQFVLSAYLVTCLVHRRILGRRWLLLGAVAFLSVWTLREGLTNPQFQHAALNIAMQKLAFYFINDLWNSFAPLGADIPATLGAHTLRGLMVLSFTDAMLEPVLAERVHASDLVRGGGEFSLLTAPYVDFGMAGGVFFLCLAGFLVRRIHERARTSLLWSALYAQVGAALLFSSHGLYVTHQNCLFSLLVIAAVLRLSRIRLRRVPMPARHALASHVSAPPTSPPASPLTGPEKALAHG